jgi:hypothetical protein
MKAVYKTNEQDICLVAPKKETTTTKEKKQKPLYIYNDLGRTEQEKTIWLDLIFLFFF